VIERSKLIAQPILTFLDDDNPCGVLLCGPVDPLAVMHSKMSDDQDSEDGADSSGAEDETLEDASEDGSGSDQGEEEEEEEEEDDKTPATRSANASGATKGKSSPGRGKAPPRAGTGSGETAAAQNRKCDAPSVAASPIKVQSPKGKGREVETAAWDGKPVDGWPVTPSSWLRCVEKALRCAPPRAFVCVECHARAC